MSQQSPLPSGRVLRHVASQDAQASSSGLFSLTYEPFYGLQEKPFSLSADPRFLFRSAEHAPAFEKLLNGIRRREGLITLTGEIGTGKTTLIRSVLQNLDRRTFTAFVPDPFVSREDLLKMLLVDFGVVSIADLKRGMLSGASRPDLSYPLYEFLDSLVGLQAFAVLIIDEAQNLPLPLLEEVRILSDLEGRERLLQVVLVGQPELRDHLRLPEMRQVNQRVSIRCELTPLKRQGVEDYIAHRLKVASEGKPGVMFSSAAIDTVYQTSRGTPRLINLICDRALHLGFNARAECIEPQFVWDAVHDLGLEISPETKAFANPSLVEPKKAPAARTTPQLVPKAEPAPLASERMHARSAVRVPRGEGQLLADFAPESDLDVPVELVNDSIARGWLLVAATTVVAVLALSGLFIYARVQAASEVGEVKFPPAPKRIVATLPAITPRFTIQVASFQTMTRAGRLVEQLTNAGYYTTRAVAREVGDDGRIVEVLVGEYPTWQEAGPDLAVLQSRHGFFDARIEPFVKTAAP
jgi:type II secretory pathway predicted ATPase ExeA